MKKNEFVAAIAKKAGVSQKEVESIISVIPEIIIEDVRDGGDSISIPGLGIFKQKVNAARVGRNPLKNVSIDIPESRIVKFQVSSTIKKVVESPKSKNKKK